METIKNKLERFYSPISDYKEGGPNTRYKSWEWCHDFFMKNRIKAKKGDKDSEQIIDQMALHLAFYLASWGMYRGSSYLLQRDYKAHKPAIRKIINQKYEMLWNYEPTENNIEEAKNLLFNQEDGIYWGVKNSYRNYDGNGDDASDTLTTKILMGTFGCIPAFDRYLKDGISIYIKNNNNIETNDYKLGKKIEDKKSNTFLALSYLAINKKSELKLSNYPPMKCLDIYFWQIGYELDIAASLVNGKNKPNKKKKLLEKAKELGICNIKNNITNEESFEQVSQQIKSLNK